MAQTKKELEKLKGKIEKPKQEIGGGEKERTSRKRKWQIRHY